MKNIFSLLLLMNSVISFGQSLEVYGGPAKNSFFDFPKDRSHYLSEYKSAWGYSAGLALDSILLTNFEICFTLQYDNYGGDFRIVTGGQGSTAITEGKTNKSIISFGFYPVNFHLKKFTLNVGGELSTLVGEEFSGIYVYGGLGVPYKQIDLRVKYVNLSSFINFGLKARIEYDIRLSRSITISPQYVCYLGLVQEFPGNNLQAIRSFRQFPGVGLKFKLK